MKKSLSILFLIVIASIALQSVAQNKKIDSLLTLLKTDKEDTNKVIHFYIICKEYRKIGEYDKGLVYGKQALSLAQNLGFKKGIANSYGNLGVIYASQGDYPEAFKSYFSALKLYEEIRERASCEI